MDSQDKGWFQGSDEGSKGEGLSRFLGVQFQIANGLVPIAPPGFVLSSVWLNSPRADYVNNDPDDNHPDAVNGCTTLFIWYLNSQLGYSVEAIIAAAASRLAGVYKHLTGRTDGWTSFINLVNSHYPQGRTYNPIGDNLFPVSELSAINSINHITCGYGATTDIFISSPAMAEVVIHLTSDMPSLVVVPATVTIPIGSMSAAFTVQTHAIAIPFAPKTIKVHAAYAGKSLTMTVGVAPPGVASLSISPASVQCGQTATGTVLLDNPSLLGPVVVNLINGAPGFATVPAQVTVLPNQHTAIFPITTPVIEVPFSPAHAVLFASYAGTSRSATLTVNPIVVAGVLHSLTLFPSTIKGGIPVHGTVTLEHAVNTDTVVGLAAVDSGAHIPIPGSESPYAHVPASLIIPAGGTSATFQVTTSHIPSGSSKHVTIIAGAVVSKYAALTLTA